MVLAEVGASIEPEGTQAVGDRPGAGAQQRPGDEDEDWSGSDDGIPIDAYVVELPAYDPNGSLPAEIIAFDATPEGGTINVDWETANEVNVSHFTIELRAEEDAAFANAGDVPAEGAGSYTFSTRTLRPGTYYVRLRTVDTDGSEQVGDLIAVTVTASGDPTIALHAASPTEFYLEKAGTPFAPNTTINAYDGLGRVTYHSDDPQARIDASGWRTGAYTIEVLENGNRTTLRWVRAVGD